METLLAMNGKSTAILHGNNLDESSDLDRFLRHRLGPLLQKLMSRLSQCEQAADWQEYTRHKIRQAYCIVESLDREYDECQQRLGKAISVASVTQALDEALVDLTENYGELELAVATLDDTLEGAIDAVMSAMEQLDEQISDALGRASTMRDKVNHTIHQVAEIASDHMDQFRRAMADGAQRLLLYDELPAPWKSNKHIHTGYRFLHSAADCWYSLLYVHNETGNIYTHLLGFALFFALGIYELFFSDLLPTIPLADRVFFLVFFLAACKCLLCSTVWHTLSGVSDLNLYRRVACLDYVGISVLICASIVLCEYYGFYCRDPWRNSYIAGTSTLALIGVTMPLQPWFDKHERRWLRITFFVTLASSGVIPIIHLCLIHGFSATMTWLSPVIKSLGSYVLGVIVYGNQLPEKIWPGKFDHFGHSHQLWHIFVCGGIWFHYTAALHFIHQRDTFEQCVLP